MLAQCDLLRHSIAQFLPPMVDDLLATGNCVDHGSSKLASAGSSGLGEIAYFCIIGILFKCKRYCDVAGASDTMTMAFEAIVPLFDHVTPYG